MNKNSSALMSGPSIPKMGMGIREGKVNDPSNSPPASDLSQLSDPALLEVLKRWTSCEREATVHVLQHLREVERRRLFLEIGFPSLFEYAVKELGYSEAAAYRRIATMRAMRDVPELQQALETGRLSVGTVSRAQTFLRREKFRLQSSPSNEEKRELFFSLAGKSAREVERELVARSPESALPESRERVVSETQTELRVILQTRVMEKLWRVRDLGAHRLKDVNSHPELIELALDLALRILDPTEALSAAPAAAKTGTSQSGAVAEPLLPPRNQQSQSDTMGAGEHVSSPPPSLPSPPPLSLPLHQVARPPSRYIRVEDKRRIWRRDGGMCAYVDRQSGRRCASRHRLQVDHIVPFALGGPTAEENLRLLCAQHNSHAGQKWFGRRWT